MPGSAYLYKHTLYNRVIIILSSEDTYNITNLLLFVWKNMRRNKKILEKEIGYKYRLTNDPFKLTND